MQHYLEFEKPIAELESKIKELRKLSEGDGVNIVDEIARLQAKLERLLHQTYGRLTPWQKAQVARHADRPHTSDYIGRSLTISCHLPVTVVSAKTSPLSRAWAASVAVRSLSWGMKRERIPPTGCATTLVMLARKVIAKRCA